MIVLRIMNKYQKERHANCAQRVHTRLETAFPTSSEQPSFIHMRAHHMNTQCVTIPYLSSRQFIIVTTDVTLTLQLIILRILYISSHFSRTKMENGDNDTKRK